MRAPKYCYVFKDDNGFNEIILDMDFLEAVTYAATHGTQHPNLTNRKIVDRDLREVATFRDSKMDGK